MKANFTSIAHAHALTIHVQGLEVNVGELLETVRGIISNIDTADSDLLSHEEIADKLKETIGNETYSREDPAS